MFLFFSASFVSIFLCDLAFYVKCSNENCDKRLQFDGEEIGILNMQRYLIAHEVLRDYMFQFLFSRFVFASALCRAYYWKRFLFVVQKAVVQETSSATFLGKFNCYSVVNCKLCIGTNVVKISFICNVKSTSIAMLKLVLFFVILNIFVLFI